MAKYNHGELGTAHLLLENLTVKQDFSSTSLRSLKFSETDQLRSLRISFPRSNALFGIHPRLHLDIGELCFAPLGQNGGRKIALLLSISRPGPASHSY